MRPADRRCAEFLANAVVHLRATKKSISLARGYLPASPRDTRALKLLAALLKIEREIEAIAEPAAVQTSMAVAS